MSEDGVSPPDIAAEVGPSRSTVYCWLKKWQEEHTVEDRPRPGPSRITTAAEDQRIVEDVLTHPLTIAVATKHRLQLLVSAILIRRRLHENRIRHRTPAKKTKVNRRHRQLRLQFAGPTRKHVRQHPTGKFIAGEHTGQNSLLYTFWEHNYCI